MRAFWIVVALAMSASVVGQELPMQTALYIRNVEVTGNLIPQSILDQALPQYQNRNVTADELLQLARSLTEYLIAQGYVNSGVILPDQKIDSGIVRLETVVGRLDRVVINGRRNISSRRIATLFDDLSTGAFNINDAVARLQMLEREPLVRRINAELKPGVERGKALLNIDMEEQRAFGASVGTDNHIPPNVGSHEEFVDAYHRSLFGMEDTARVHYRNAEGFAGGAVEYRLPITVRTGVDLRYSADESLIVAQPFKALDIRGKSQRYGAAMRATLIDNLATQLAIDLGAQKEQVQSYLLDEPFSFSSADTEGRSTIVLAQFGQEWLRRAAARAFAIRSTISVGLATWDASIGGAADGQFVEWLVQGEWIERLSWRDGTIGLRAQLHLANDELPAFRKYPLGGVNSVRGYRESLIMCDNGATASLEWKTILARLPVHWLSFGASRGTDGQLSIAPFIDYGRGWNQLEDRNAAVELAGVGAALRWQPASNTAIELQYAKPLIHYDLNAVTRELADDGIYFSARVGF